MQSKSIILSIGFCLLFGLPNLIGQLYIEGYTFESGNRGYLSQVVVNAENAKTGEFLKQVTSDNEGKFVFDFPPGVTSVKLTGMKSLFHDIDVIIGPEETTDGKAYVKMQLKRQPGYIFEITLAEKTDSIGSPTNHIRNALIEVYNNTTEKVVMVLEDHPQPDFKVDLEKGNHYTVMIRKEGYLTKRMEAFVDVEGCILCFEGIGDVRPGVSDNLSEENSNGTLLANVELESVFEGKSIELQNIYYDYGKSNINDQAAIELDKAATFLRDNPQITVELGSHSDSRGKAEQNLNLSVKRAQSAVDYLVNKGDVERFRITAQGYGESKLAVKCGSDCTEAEHAKNRRSEIKVLGINNSIPIKSLEKIKYEENFDNIIAALQEEGVVKVPEDGELPDALKSQITEDVSDTDVKTEVEEKKSAIEKAVVDKKEMIEEVSKDVEVPAVPEVVEEIIETKAVSVPSAPETVEEVMETKTVNVPSAPEVVEEVMETKAVSSPAKTGEVMTAENYTGHKVVVAFRRTKIEAGDALAKQFSDLSVYQAKAGYFLYMAGDFETKSDAESYLSTIIADNPNAYLVEFDNGNRVN